jgi:hypothetical protein
VFLIYLLAEQGLAVCKAVIAKYNLLNELGTANVSKDRPLQVGHDVVHNIGDTQGGSGYGFVLFKARLCLLEVCCNIIAQISCYINIIKHFSAFYLHKVRR